MQNDYESISDRMLEKASFKCMRTVVCHNGSINELLYQNMIPVAMSISHHKYPGVE
jgi:hypothetical protein